MKVGTAWLGTTERVQRFHELRMARRTSIACAFDVAQPSPDQCRTQRVLTSSEWTCSGPPQVPTAFAAPVVDGLHGRPQAERAGLAVFAKHAEGEPASRRGSVTVSLLYAGLTRFCIPLDPGQCGIGRAIRNMTSPLASAPPAAFESERARSWAWRSAVAIRPHGVPLEMALPPGIEGSATRQFWPAVSVRPFPIYACRSSRRATSGAATVCPAVIRRRRGVGPPSIWVKSAGCCAVLYLSACARLAWWAADPRCAATCRTSVRPSRNPAWRGWR